MKRTRALALSSQAALQRELWMRTLKSAVWYLPLVHIGYPCVTGWPWARRARSMPPPARLAGIGLIVGGSALTGTSVYTLVRYGEGTPAPHDPPQRFVCQGPYQLCRNPMELGNLLMLLGRAVVVGSPAVAVASVLFGATVHLWIVLVEEPYLLRHFGLEYRTYQQRVARWGWPRRQ